MPTKPFCSSPGLPSMGSHRVRHNWSNLAAAAAAAGPIDFTKTKFQCIHLWDLSSSRKLNLVTMVSLQRPLEWLSNIVTNLLLLGGTLPSSQVTQPRAKESTWVLPWDNPGRNLFPTPALRHTILRPSSPCFLPSWNSARPQTCHCVLFMMLFAAQAGGEVGGKQEAGWSPHESHSQPSRGLPLIRDRPG